MSLKRLLFGEDSSSRTSATTSTPSTEPRTLANSASEYTSSAASAKSSVHQTTAPLTDTNRAPQLQSSAAPASSIETSVYNMSASSNSSGSDAGASYSKNISQAGLQAKLHATQSVAPEGTGSSAPAELRAGIASTPSSSVLDQAAVQNQFNPSPNFSSAGAQARAAAAGAAPAGTHSANIGPAAVSSQVSPNVSAMTASGVGAPGSLSYPSEVTAGAASKFPSDSPYQPTEPSTPQNAGFIHAFNTINELDDLSATEQPPSKIQPDPQQDVEPLAQQSETVIHALNTAAELSNTSPSSTMSSTNASFSPAGYDALAAAAGAAPAGTVQSQDSPPSVNAPYETEHRVQAPSSSGELLKNYSTAGFAAKQFATHTIAPEGTVAATGGSATTPFVNAVPSQGSIPTTPTTPGSDPNVSQAGLAARQGATQAAAPEGTGHWGKKSYSTMAAGRGSAGSIAMRVASRRPGPLAARVGAVGIAGLLHFIA